MTLQRMNHVSLDSIGLAGFSHDFAALDGRKGPVISALEAFEALPKPSSIHWPFYFLAKVPCTFQLFIAK